MNQYEKPIRKQAIEAGFDRVGFAALGRPETAGAFLRWLAKGSHAGMKYLERRVEKRLEPRSLLPGAKSAVCVALRYWPLQGVSDDKDSDLWPGVAKYARGDDYHDLMKARLRDLEARIRDLAPGTRTLSYVDTGPILERDLAANSGLGVFGKNCNLLHAEMGSWYLLGEILTTLELTPDVPIADLCGSCSECLEACPTDALTAPFQLDSNRCISYWTIEHRGAIPLEVRDTLGEWVFGCDICQDVCPVNETPRAARHPELELPEKRKDLGLTELLDMTRDEYVESFRGSAMKRAKLPGLKRNAAVAMGNRGEPSYLEPLTRALADEDPVVRGHSAWALGRLRSQDSAAGAVVLGALETAFERETDSETAGEMRAALEVCRSNS